MRDNEVMSATARGLRGYHHGDLANALAEAGVKLAAEGGPEAIVLREAARQVGVSATAAYRHYESQQALVDTVKQRIMMLLADRMQEAVAALPPTADPADMPIAQLMIIGRSYFGFAINEPGLFTTMCTGELPEGMNLGSDVAAFGHLARLIDQMVAVGRMPEQRRQGAEMAAWALVHGLAMLCLGSGPLSVFSKDQQWGFLESTMQIVHRGMVGPDIE